MARTPADDLARSPEDPAAPNTFEVLLDDLSRITVDERGTVTAVGADLIRKVRPGDRVAAVNQRNPADGRSRPLDVALLSRRLGALSEGRCVLTIERDDRSEPQSPRSPWGSGSGDFYGAADVAALAALVAGHAVAAPGGAHAPRTVARGGRFVGAADDADVPLRVPDVAAGQAPPRPGRRPALTFICDPRPGPCDQP